MGVDVEVIKPGDGKLTEITISLNTANFSVV